MRNGGHVNANIWHEDRTLAMKPLVSVNRTLSRDGVSTASGVDARRTTCTRTNSVRAGAGMAAPIRFARPRAGIAPAACSITA